MIELTGTDLLAVTGGNGTQDSDHAAYRAYRNADMDAWNKAAAKSGWKSYLPLVAGIPARMPVGAAAAEYRAGATDRFMAGAADAKARAAAVQNGGLMGAITVPHQ
jgi:hypothetical protein